MTLVVSSVSKLAFMTDLLDIILTLKLYSNNRIPIVGDLVTDYTEVTGGGYASKSLAVANWTKTSATPSVATYNAVQEFLFTGPTTAPGTIYGYYLVDASNALKWAERFTESLLPLVPINGNIIRITPKLSMG